MKKKFKFGVIGAGFMSTAIINGVLKSKILKSKEIIVSDINSTALDKWNNCGVSVTTDNKYLVENSEFVLFAIKPQQFSVVLNEISNCDMTNNFISIMAGVKKSKFKDVIKKAKVARCMPNTPCSIGYGAVGIDLSDYDNQEKAFIKSIFSSFALVCEVNEDKLNTVTGISGSSPAYYYLFVKGIIEAGVKNGLDFDTAKKLAVQTMIGAGNMLLKNDDKSIDDLITAVCSKGGTTIEAVNVYNSHNLTEITGQAVDACIKRSTELENL